MNGKRGFTLIELLVVMTILGLLLTLASPRYFGGINKTREAVLKENLATLRQTVDRFYADTDHYPASLEELVARRYLHAIPEDPMTEKNTTWVIIAPDDPAKGGVINVRSGAVGKARDGTSYSEW